MSTNSTKHLIHKSKEFVKSYENKSNNGSINEEITRYSFNSNNLMSIESINKYVISFLLNIIIIFTI